ncbi:MAG: hypothetical protein M3Y40_06820 [Chloroflexota bacterium]|nr:hypothetical protein [Chloroflexota bacterium]
MSRWSLPLAVLLAGCAAATSPPPSPAGPRIVVAHDSLETSYALAGAAVVHDGTVHLWTAITSGIEGDGQRIVHLTSSDLRTWEGDPTQPVLDDVAMSGFDAIGPVPSSVLIEPDGTWRMFGGGRLAEGDTSILWMATAPGPDGPWTLHRTAILLPERVGWDGLRVDHPSVVRTDDGYLMAYGGASPAGPNRGRIGFARSTDAISWIRVPTSLEGADDDLALGPAACDVDARTMVEPELRVTDDGGMRLDFGLIEVGGDEMVIASATSEDAVTWTCTTEGPILEAADVDGLRNLHSFLPLRVDDREVFLVELLAPGSGSSDLWLVDR